MIYIQNTMSFNSRTYNVSDLSFFDTVKNIIIIYDIEKRTDFNGGIIEYFGKTKFDNIDANEYL